ncbi:alpha/beta fold hydrolase [Pseudooceanicola aestuarii]|uniref:alpha/beta fold hydrolase n=1 Tax=Pseudooceanicola aestuarii TaxID=2697319 RepID=UPI0013D851A4|nr:alpha/beta fold hydrolase [Pseudooceanicola aestuarii]
MTRLTCIPGLMSTGTVFDRLAARMGRAVAVAQPAADDDFARLAAGLAAGMQPRTVLLGHSMGAYLALAVALRMPERIAGLVLVSASAAADTPQAAAMRAKTVDWARRKGLDALAQGQVQTLLAPDNRARADLGAVMQAMAHDVGLDTFAAHQTALATRPDQTDALPGIGCPALVLTGALDCVTPPATGRALAKALPNAQFHEIPGAGHMPPLEAPEALAGHLTAFIDTLPQKAPAT